MLGKYSKTLGYNEQSFKKNKTMTTLTLQIENQSILAHLKEVLKEIRGVKIMDATVEDTPNALTLAAMKEAESNEDAGIVCMDNMESFIASMK